MAAGVPHVGHGAVAMIRIACVGPCPREELEMRRRDGSRRSSTCFVSLTLLLAASGGSSQQSRTAPASKAAYESFVFAWPVPANVRITERALKRGKTAVKRYTATLVPHENGEDLLLSLRDFDFVELEGLDLVDPAVKKALAPALAMTSAIPDLRIGKNGDLLGVVGIDRLAQRIVEFLGRVSGGEDKQKLAAMAQAFKNPRVLKTLEEAGSQSWLAWVGAWTRLGGIEQGGKAELTASTKAGSQQIHAEHLGPAEGKPGHVNLLMRTRTDGEKAGELIQGFLQEMTPKKGGEEIPEIEECEVVTTVRAVTDPKTLMPLRVELEKRIRIKMGGKETNGLERREYDFDWSATDQATRRSK